MFKLKCVPQSVAWLLLKLTKLWSWKRYRSDLHDIKSIMILLQKLGMILKTLQKWCTWYQKYHDFVKEIETMFLKALQNETKICF